MNPPVTDDYSRAAIAVIQAASMPLWDGKNVSCSRRASIPCHARQRARLCRPDDRLRRASSNLRGRFTLILVMAGLVPAIHVLSIEAVVQVLPIRVHGEDQPDFPGSRPVLHVPFALNGTSYRLVVRTPHETRHALSRGEAGHHALTVLPSAARDVTRHAGVEDAIWLVRQNVDPAPVHGPTLQFVDGRDKPGDDKSEGQTYPRPSSLQ